MEEGGDVVRFVAEWKGLEGGGKEEGVLLPLEEEAGVLALMERTLCSSWKGEEAILEGRNLVRRLFLVGEILFSFASSS